jgi:hypothetical protein
MTVKALLLSPRYHMGCGTVWRHLTLPILSWQYCLCGLWERLLTTMVGFRMALDSVNNGTLVRAAAHILCGTVRGKCTWEMAAMP